MTPALRESFERNRAAIDAANLSQGVARSGIADPFGGCILCGNTVVVRGYDCWACETAFDTDVRDTSALASAIGRALELQMDAERGS